LAFTDKREVIERNNSGEKELQAEREAAREAAESEDILLLFARKLTLSETLLLKLSSFTSFFTKLQCKMAS
jgi:hypothetical protein